MRPAGRPPIVMSKKTLLRSVHNLVNCEFSAFFQQRTRLTLRFGAHVLPVFEAKARIIGQDGKILNRELTVISRKI